MENLLIATKYISKEEFTLDTLNRLYDKIEELERLSSRFADKSKLEEAVRALKELKDTIEEDVKWQKAY